jgi:hypothetical protein
MKTRPGLSIRDFILRMLDDERLAPVQTAIKRTSDEAIANPGGDALALVTDRGRLGLDNSRLDG